jgi:hypothetical protein
VLPATVALAACFLGVGLFCGWRAVGSTGSERSRFWMLSGVASCGMWFEIILILLMLYLR